MNEEDPIVCYCKNLKNSELCEFKSVKEAMKETQAGTFCGTCQPDLQELFRKEPHHLTKFIRLSHLWLSLMSCILLFFFSFSGFVLNHPNFFGLDDVETIEKTLSIPKNIDLQNQYQLIQFVKKELSSSGYADELSNEEGRISFDFRSPGDITSVEIDIETRELHSNRERSNLWTKLGEIHKGENTKERAGDRFVDLGSILLFLTSITGFFLWYSSGLHRKAGTIIISLSLLTILTSILFFLS